MRRRQWLVFGCIFLVIALWCNLGLCATHQTEMAPDGMAWIQSSVLYWAEDDPNLDSEWDWRDDYYTVYWDRHAGGPWTLPSPFNSEFTGGVAFTKDYEPEDGWVLFFRNFGSEQNYLESPYFILYNKYTGLLRVFILVDAEEHYTNGSLSLLFDPEFPDTTALLTHASHRAWAADNYNKENVAVAMTEIHVGHWIYADFVTAYDPSTANVKDSVLKLRLDGVNVTDVMINGTQSLTQVLPKSSTPSDRDSYTLKDLAVDGKHVAGFYNTFQSYKDQFKKMVDKQANSELKEKLTHLAGSWVCTNLPYIGAAVGLVDLFIGGGREKQKESPVPMVFNGEMTLSGTLKERNFITEFSIQTPGASHASPNFVPLYDYPLGILNLRTTPILESREYWQSIRPGHTMYYSSYKMKNDLNWEVNPYSDLELQDMEAALVFRLDKVYTYPYDHLPLLPDCLESGIYEIESSTDGKYVLRTRYIPYHLFKGTAISVPPGTDVTIKIKAVLTRKNGTPETQPVLFVADYEPVFEKDSIMNNFPWSEYQQPSTPPSVEITQPIEALVLVSTPVMFTCRSNGGPVDTYEWDFGDGTAYEYGNTVFHTFQSEGAYTVTLTATGPGGEDTQSVTLTAYGPGWLENPGFEEGLDFWTTYGDGFVEDTTQDVFTGRYSAHIERGVATDRYFGLYQEDILVEPDTTYRLSLWVKTRATSGRIAGGLGVWSSDSSLNHHNDFGHIGGMTDWVQISGTWRSRPDEHVMRVMLFGNPDFVGEAWFDGLVLEEVEPRNGGFEKGLDHWESYGDGTAYETVEGGVEGSYGAGVSRDWATGHYFGLVQRGIPCEPNTAYRLTLWVSTEAESGHAAAALGNWGTPNTHVDFGHTGGYTDWTEISGTWTSGEDETSMDIVLYGNTDFSGWAYFDGLVLEKLGAAPLSVRISGPDALGYKKTGEFMATVSRGSGEYHYEWYQRLDGSSTWRLLGSRDETQSCMMFSQGFTLRIDVCDALTGQEGSANFYVEYLGGGGDKKKSRLVE